MKKLPSIISNSVIFFCSLLSFNSSAQTVQLTVAVLPPYSVYPADYVQYKNQMLITITNLTLRPLQIKLKAKFSGDNGVLIESDPNFIPPSPITLAPNSTNAFSGLDLAPYFENASINIIGTSKEALLQGRPLPEGNYQLCVTAYDYTTSEMLSDEMLGCSAWFPINYAEAPILTNPTCGDTIAFQSPQNIVFSWMQPPVISARVQYNFKIVEVIPQDRNVNDAMNSATTPPFFETTLNIPVFVYSAAQPAFEEGHKYAWQVTVTDASGRAYFLNDGKSEVCSFVMGAKPVFSNGDVTGYVPPVTVVNHNHDIKGTLKYYFESQNPNENFPAKHLEVRLMVRYNLYDASGNNELMKNISDNELPTQYADANSMLASSVTDDDGNFDLQVNSLFIAGFVDENYTQNLMPGMMGGVSTSVNGKLKREYELWVMDNHYCQPEKYSPITLSVPNLNMGTVLTRVRDYSLVVDVNKIMKSGSPSNSGSNAGAGSTFQLAQMFLAMFGVEPKEFKIQILREQPGIEGIPEKEGMGFYNPNDFVPSEVIAEATTDGGITTFHRLVKSLGQNDHYKLRISPANAPNSSDAALEFEFHFYYFSDYYVDPVIQSNDLAVYNHEYETLTLNWSQLHSTMTLCKSYIEGNIKYMYADPDETEKYPLQNMVLYLKVYYIGMSVEHGKEEPLNDCLSFGGADGFQDIGKIVSATTTDWSGNFSFKISDQIPTGNFSEETKFGSGEFQCNWTNIRRVYRIEVGSPHYCSPSQNIYLTPGDYEKIPDITTKIKSYGLSVSVKALDADWCKIQQVTGGADLSGATVRVFRKIRPSDVPSNEGTVGVDGQYGDMELIGDADIDGGATTVTFRRLVKDFYSNEIYFLEVNTDKTVDKNYYAMYQFSFSDKNVKGNKTPPYTIWASDYQYPEMSYTAFGFPNMPYIRGFVVRSNNAAQTLKDVTVLLNSKWQTVETETDWIGNTTTYYNNYETANGVKTPTDGTFLLENIQPETYPGGSKQYNRYISFAKDGYHSLSLFNMPDMKWGSKWELGMVQLEPGGILFGKVVNEDGDGVNSMVQFNAANDNGPAQHTDNSPVGLYFYQLPLGFNWQLVNPDEEKYFDDFGAIIMDNVLKFLPDFIVYEKLHRHRFDIYTGGWLMPVGVKGAKISIKDHPEFGIRYTDKDGECDFKFEGPDDETSYTFIIEGPDGSEYVPQTVTATSKPGKYFGDTKYVYLPPGMKIYGAVKNGADAVDGALVKLIYPFNPDYPVSISTDGSGKYELHHVPKTLGTMFRASKMGSGLVADTAVVSVLPNGNDALEINFDLNAATSNLELTKLLGFTLDLYAVNVSGGNVKITGALYDGKDNGFISSTEMNPAFEINDLLVKEGTVMSASGKYFPVPVDAESEVRWNGKNEMNVKVNGAFEGRIGNAPGESGYGMKLVKVADDKGSIKGKVRIISSAFSTSAVALDKGDLYLCTNSSDAATKFLLTNFFSQNNAPMVSPTTYNVCDKDGANFFFRIYGLTVEALSPNSKVSDGKLNVDARIHTNISKLIDKDINMSIGMVTVHNNGVDDVNGTSEIILPLSAKWKIHNSNWKLSKQGLDLVSSGYLDADGLAFPQKKNIGITNSDLELETTGTFDVQNLKLLNTLPITVTGDAQFGYNTSQKFWQVSVVNPWDPQGTAATFTGLPAFNTGTVIKLQSIVLKSTGTSQYKMTEFNSVLYNWAGFNVYSGLLGVTEKSLTIAGQIDLKIPLVNPQNSAALINKNPDGTLSFKLQQFPMSFAVTPVQLLFTDPNAKFDETGYFSKGTIKEPAEGFNLNVFLWRSANDSIVINTIGIPKQNFFYAGNDPNRYMKDVYGRMRVVADHWSSFAFTGNVVGGEGMSGMLTLEVKSAITADGQSVQMENISTPFGSMSIMYEYSKARLFSHLEIDNFPLPGAGTIIHGDVNSVFDKDGWFFVTGATLHIDAAPYINNVQTCILFGNFPNPATEPIISAIVKDYTYAGQLPTKFQTAIKGFFISAKATIPLIPNFELGVNSFLKHIGADPGFDLPDPFILSIGATAYGGVNIGMNMAGSTSTYYVDAKVWVDSHASCGSTIDMGVVTICVKAGFTCNPSIFVAGEYNSDGTWYVKGDFDFPFAGGMTCGIGPECDGSCEYDSFMGVPTCIPVDLPIPGFDFGFHAKMGSNGSDIEFTGF